MKKTAYLALFFVLMCVYVSASMVEEAKPLTVLSQNPSGIQMSLKTNGLSFSDVSVNGDLMQRPQLKNFNYPTDETAPAIPFYSMTIAIPARGDYSITVNERNIKSIENIKVAPVDEDSFGFGLASYQPQGIYPQRLLEYSEPSILRDFRIIQLNLYPLQWDASSREMRLAEDLDINITFNDQASINEMDAYTGYSPIFEKLYASTLANFDYYRMDRQTPVHPVIQIIHGHSTDASFQQKLAGFVAWKRQKGYTVNVASTQVSGSSNTAIKNYLAAQYANPATKPDFVILLGDVTGSYAIPAWNETLSSYNGEGDYPYTHLAGNDLLGDVYIGRISAENFSQLDVLINKIYAYEKNINNSAGAAAWLNRVLLIGDPTSSGISTIYTNKFIKERARQANPEYSFIENYSSGFSNTINQGINQGVGFFNYRGYIGMSGWSPSGSLINGTKLPHAVIITCSTGSYSGTSTSESFIRLGTSATPSGAITAIGMATSGTHTGFNNAINAGIFDGIFTWGMRTMGEALLSGRLNIANVYNASNPNQANYFSHWCNLMGDPTVEVFVGIPKTLVLSVPTLIPNGTHMIDALVTDENAIPMPDVAVTVYSNQLANVAVRGFTDENGNISLILPANLSGDLVITASKHDCKPVQVNSMVDSAGSLVFEQAVIDDTPSGSTNGNSNGTPNPGETVGMSIVLKNTTTQPITINSVSVSSTDPHVTITQANTSFAQIAPDQTGLSLQPIIFSIGNNPPANHDIRFNMSISDLAGTQYNIPYHVYGINAKLLIQTVQITAGANSVLDPSENGYISIGIKNESLLDISNVQAELISMNDLVMVTDSLSAYGTILAGATVNSSDSFVVFARPQLITGMQIPMKLRIFNNSGFEQFAYFNINIGTPSVNTPLGPDAYGYFIYDSGDTAYPDCPVYEWQEIHPSLGGTGTLIPLSDAGDSNNEGDQVGSNALSVVDLPFPFSFYGLEYNQITVCSNGFIAMGVTENGDFRNYRLPGPLGPAPMIAAFWDDLILISDAGVYKYYNAADHTFIIQYHKLRNGFNRTSEETFQVIFYDPMFYPTGLGDGMIKIQYKVFNNVDAGGGGYTPRHGNFATIGIKDHTNTTGLEYSYNNQYPPTAAPLSNQKAILITTTPVLHQSPYLVIAETIVSESNGNGIVEPGEQVDLGIKLSNLGLDTATQVRIQTSINNQYITVVNDSSSYNNISGSSYGININPIKIMVSENCPANHVIQIPCQVIINGNSWQYSVSIPVRKPALEIAGLLVNDNLGNANGIIEPGETFKLIVNYTNGSQVEARNVTSNIFCADSRVTIHNAEQLLNEIPIGTTMQAVYQVTFGTDIPVGSFVTFYLTYMGDLLTPQNEQIMVSCGTTGMNADFEVNNGGFTASPSTNGWEWGTSSYAGAHSGVKVWGTRLNTQYPNGATYSVTSPDVYIGQGFVLEFYHRYDMEATYDGGNLKVSANGGSTWTLLNPEGGYSHTNVAALGEPGYSGSLLNWSLARFNLSNYANQTLRFKWTFASDNMIQGQGWFIDDVTTSGSIDFATMISGVISSGNADLNPVDVLIKASDGMAVHPNAQSNYEIFVPAGNHSLQVSCPGYQTQNTAPMPSGLTNPMYVLDFYLGYLKPIPNLSFDINEASLVLSWQAPDQPEFPVLGYKLFRKLNADRFEQLAQVTETVYNATLTDLGTYTYYVVVLYNEGESVPSNNATFSYPYTDNEDPANTPLVTKLYGNYPNPFNPDTTIRFTLKDLGKTKLSVYNAKGQLVKTLVNENLDRGEHRIVWNGMDNKGKRVSSGLYFYRLESGKTIQVKKMVLMK